MNKWEEREVYIRIRRASSMPFIQVRLRLRRRSSCYSKSTSDRDLVHCHCAVRCVNSFGILVPLAIMQAVFDWGGEELARSCAGYSAYWASHHFRMYIICHSLVAQSDWRHVSGTCVCILVVGFMRLKRGSSSWTLSQQMLP